MPDYSREIADLEKVIAAAGDMKARYERGFVSFAQDDIRLLNAVGNFYSGYALDQDTDKVVRDLCIEHSLDDHDYEPIPVEVLTAGFVDRVDYWER